jgi:Rrf2 family protein
VNISAKVEYACIAVLELAARSESDEPVRIREIADAHGIPSRFLVQILLQLKGAGLVQSTRGATGGYALAKPPQRITLAEVMAVIDGPSDKVQSNVAVETAATRVLLSVWNKVGKLQQETLEATTFAELAQRMRDPLEEMYHI